MTTQEIANRLYELCKKGEYETAKKELYSENVSSTESNMHGSRETVNGIKAVDSKSQQFQSMIEERFGGYTNEPKAFGNFIFMEMGMDVKMKNMDRMNMVEMCRYEVKDGKIIAEEFYY